MFKSLIRFRGPGNAFATPITAGVTDSPYRLTKFKLRPIRHDFQNVLTLGDSKCLERAAKEVISSNHQHVNGDFDSENAQLGRKLLDQRLLSKSRGFWIVFSKRIKASAYILPPKTISLVLRAFHTANKDTGIYVALADPIKYIIKSIDGLSLYWILNVLSKKLKGNCNKDLFEMLGNQLLNVLYQVTGPMAIEICSCLYDSGYRKNDICHNVGMKVINSDIDMKDAIQAIHTFGLFKFGDDKIHKALQDKIIENIDELKSIDFAKVVIGFDKSSYDPARVLNLLESKLEELVAEIPEYIALI